MTEPWFFHDQIAFPVAGLTAVVRGERALVDREHGLCEPGSAPVGALVSTSVVPPSATETGGVQNSL